jgi:hypothetical protein
MRSMLRLSASTSSARSVRGSGAATALTPWAASPVTTRAQRDPVRPAAVGQHNAHIVHRNCVPLISYFGIASVNLRSPARRQRLTRSRPVNLRGRNGPLDRHFRLRRKASGLFENLAAGEDSARLRLEKQLGNTARLEPVGIGVHDRGYIGRIACLVSRQSSRGLAVTHLGILSAPWMSSLLSMLQ